MIIELTKGKYCTTQNKDPKEMIYYVPLNRSVGLKFVVQGETTTGGAGVDVDISEIKKLFQNYMKEGNTKIQVQVIGGDNSTASTEYIENLKFIFTDIQNSPDWHGELEVDYAVNTVIHPNFVTLLGYELDNGLTPIEK